MRISRLSTAWCKYQNTSMTRAMPRCLDTMRPYLFRAMSMNVIAPAAHAASASGVSPGSSGNRGFGSSRHLAQPFMHTHAAQSGIKANRSAHLPPHLQVSTAASKTNVRIPHLCFWRSRRPGLRRSAGHHMNRHRRRLEWSRTAASAASCRA